MKPTTTQEPQPELSEEEEGIQAIIYLQSLMEIEETHKQAQIGWRQMGEEQRKITMAVYAMLKQREVQD